MHCIDSERVAQLRCWGTLSECLPPPQFIRRSFGHYGYWEVTLSASFNRTGRSFFRLNEMRMGQVMKHQDVGLLNRAQGSTMTQCFSCPELSFFNSTSTKLLGFPWKVSDFKWFRKSHIEFLPLLILYKPSTKPLLNLYKNPLIVCSSLQTEHADVSCWLAALH